MSICVDGMKGGKVGWRVAAGLVLALAGALVAVWAHMPLPWMLGALLVTAATRIAGLRTACPRPARNAGQWVIGTSLGLYFTPQVVEHIGNNAGPIIAGMLFALGLSFIGTAILRRYTDADFKTAWFSSAIGGASEMANLAERYGARIDRVATAHSVRVLLVVVTVPFIFQGWGVAGLDPTVPGPRVVHWPGLAALVALTCMGGLLFMRLRLPNPWVLGSMSVAMTLTLSGIELSALPDYVPKIGQLFIGWSLGTAIVGLLSRRAAFHRGRGRVYAGRIGAGVRAGRIAVAMVRRAGAHVDTGYDAGRNRRDGDHGKGAATGVPVVTAFHVTRMVFVVLVTGPMYNFLARRQRDSA